MSPGTIALIIVAVSVAGWGAFMANVTIRRQRKAAAKSGAATRAHPAATGTESSVSSEQAPSDEAGGGGVATLTRTETEVTVEKIPERKLKPLTPEQLAVSRRQFLNRAWTVSFLGFLGFFGMSTLSFLWPKLTGGFGTKITAGDYKDLLKKTG